MPIILDGTNGETFPSWTTAGRPSSSTAGQTGYNSTLNSLETYNGTSWILNSGSGFSNMQVFTSSGTFTTSSTTTRLKVTVVGAGGGTSTGGTSSFGTLASATGGAASATAIGTAYVISLTPSAGGTGSLGTVNVTGQSGSVTFIANVSGSNQNMSAPSAIGGMSAFGLGYGETKNYNNTISSPGAINAGGGGGGGGSIYVGAVTASTAYTVTVGTATGGATSGIVIVEW